MTQAIQEVFGLALRGVGKGGRFLLQGCECVLAHAKRESQPAAGVYPQGLARSAFMNSKYAVFWIDLTPDAAGISRAVYT